MNIFKSKDLYMQAAMKSCELHTMTDAELNSLQKHLRLMYVEIETVCQRHGLQMMVAYGSVLGALRHHGFIPWDDDIDLLMPRKDYDRLINLYADELPIQYKVFSPNSKNGPIYRFAKVVDTSTRFTSSPGIATEKNGIFVDIFPLENAVLNKRLIRWIQIKACILMYIATSVANYEENSDEKKRIMCTTLFGGINYHIRWILGYLFSWKSKEAWFNLFDRTVSKYPESGYFMVPSAGSDIEYFRPIEQSMFIPTKRMLFDDIYVNVPNQPEKHCEMVYGNWKEIPPENKRWRHFIKEIRFNVNSIENK